MSDQSGRRGLCLVLSAPSGAGKTSLARALVTADANLQPSISVTTRAPRPGERDQVDYLFRTESEFAELRRSGALLESATVFGNSYGTPREPVEAALAAGVTLVFDIDWQGHSMLRAQLPADTVSVFLLPPSLHALQDRLAARGDSTTQIANRMEQAKREISHWLDFDYTVTNHLFDEALNTLRAILTAARAETKRRSLPPF